MLMEEYLEELEQMEQVEVEQLLSRISNAEVIFGRLVCTRKNKTFVCLAENEQVIHGLLNLQDWKAF